MDASDQVIFLLKVMINIMPVAVYFLVLGLVNSQAQPVLVNARSDFQILTLVFVPLLVGPMPFLVEAGQWWVLLGGAAITLGGFWRFLPGRASGWVLYNVTEAQGRAMLCRALAAWGAVHQTDDRTYHVPALGMRLEVSGFSLLRNVTVRIRWRDGAVDWGRFEALGRRLHAQMQQQALLPSATGGCLMVLGVSLMIVPLWLMSHHIDAIVEIVQRLLFA